MPLLKKDLSFPALVRVIKGYGYNSVSLAKVLGCSQPTAMKKLQTPSLFTLGEHSRDERAVPGLHRQTPRLSQRLRTLQTVSEEFGRSKAKRTATERLSKPVF